MLKGTLVIDMMDPRQKQLVFQGVSSSAISSKPTKEYQKASQGHQRDIREVSSQVVTNAGET